MADPTKDLQQMLATLLDASRRDAQVMDMLAMSKQAIVDSTGLIEDLKAVIKAHLQPAAPAPAPIVNVSPTMQSDWTSLRIDAPVDGLGRPTGQMTITKVK